MKKLNKFIKQINNNNKLIISIDLDNTLVNRAKGANWVDKRVKKILKGFVKNELINIVPNTGRDIICTRSFFNDVLNTHNAIMGSGSLIMHQDELNFYTPSQLPRKVVISMTNAIKDDIFPFIDIYHLQGRTIFYNKNSYKKYKSLFYQQNPQKWFDAKLPAIYSIDKINQKIPNNIFRLEFPVLISQTNLFNSLIEKKQSAINHLQKNISTKIDINNLKLKRKKFFCTNFQDELTFARLEYNSKQVNKGTGLKFWLKKEKLNPKKINVIHIGDQDSGLINDTLIKKHIPSAHLLMVGDKCKQNNPLVDLYLPGKNIDENLFIFLQAIKKLYDKKIKFR